MKCPHCEMDDAQVCASPKLRLLSFVFVTVACPHCSSVFAVPESNSRLKKKTTKLHHRQTSTRHIA